MEKCQKFQIMKLSIIALLFLMTPVLSESMRPPYLYFLINLLIIALGAEAGLLSFLKPPEDKKPAVIIAPKPANIFSSVLLVEASPDKKVDTVTDGESHEAIEKKVKIVEKSVSEIVSRVKVHKVKKSPSTPSLFFIGSGEVETEETEEDNEEEEGSLSGQELFTKAENFIGNFYKQLKMQREESWKRIHGFYQKAF